MAALRWATVLIVALTLAAPFTFVTAQSTNDLPAGLAEVSVDGQPVFPDGAPANAESTPEFAGFVEPGVPAADLSIVSQTIERLVLPAGSNGAFAGTTRTPLAPGDYALYVFDTYVGAFVVAAEASKASPEARENAPVDIARAVPEVPDFGEAIPGLAFLDGHHTDVAEEARRLARAAGDETPDAIDAAEADLEAGGWRQRYESRLAAPDPNDPTRFAVQVSSLAVEYAFPEQARAAFESSAGNPEAIAFATIGDASELVPVFGTTPDTGVEYGGLRLLFVQDRIFGLIVVADLLRGETDPALLESVADAVAIRAARVSSGELQGPGSATLRIAREAGARSDNEGYRVVDGAVVPVYGEETEVLATPDQRFAGVEQAYAVALDGTTTVADGGIRGEEAERPFAYSSLVLTFDSPESAEAWLQNNAATVLGGDLADAQLPTPGAGSFGEDSVTFAVTSASNPAQAGFRTSVRVGSRVAVVQFTAIPPVSTDEISLLAAAQATCLAVAPCPDPVSLQDLAGSTGSFPDDAGADGPDAVERIDPEAYGDPGTGNAGGANDPADEPIVVGTAQPRSDSPPAATGGGVRDVVADSEDGD